MLSREQTGLLFRIFSKIELERIRQEKLLTDGKIVGDCKDPNENDYFKLAVLAEEFGEVANALVEDCGNRETREHMLTELIQTAAVACAWAEALERELYDVS